jgi:hypothetical protein
MPSRRRPLPKSYLLGRVLAHFDRLGETLAPVPGARSDENHYRHKNGRTIRIKTCSDRAMLATHRDPWNYKTDSAGWSIGECDDVLIAIPMKDRVPGPAECYLVPRETVIAELIQNRERWLVSGGKPANSNFTLRFNTSRAQIRVIEGKLSRISYADLWAKYRFDLDEIEEVPVSAMIVDPAVVDKRRITTNTASEAYEGFLLNKIGEHLKDRSFGQTLDVVRKILARKAEIAPHRIEIVFKDE